MYLCVNSLAKIVSRMFCSHIITNEILYSENNLFLSISMNNNRYIYIYQLTKGCSTSCSFEMKERKNLIIKLSIIYMYLT